MGYYNSQIKLDHTKIDKLNWITGKFNYIFKNGNNIYNGIVYSVLQEDYNKLESRLKGIGSDIIKKGDKVYLMPGSKIPLFKLKDHLTKIGATKTNNINKATFFIGTSNISEITGTQAVSNSLIFKHTRPEITDNILELHQLYHTKINTESYNSLNSSGVRYPEYYLSYTAGPTEQHWIQYPYDMHFITPIGVIIIYNSILKSLPIVSEDIILDQMSPMIVIDEEIYNSLSTMLDSEDSTNHDVARELIANCDIKKSYFYLWKLSQKFKYITYTRMKNIKLFVERAAWDDLSGMSAEEFIEYMYEHDYLTPEMFKELMIEASKLYKDSLTSSVFKMVLIPSDKYKEYSNPTSKFTYHHEDEEKTRKKILKDSLVEKEEDVKF